MCLCHYPMLDWQGSFKGSWQIFGHIQTRTLDEFDTLKTRLFASQYDVGVDNNNFRPISFHELKLLIQSQTENPIFKKTNYY